MVRLQNTGLSLDADTDTAPATAIPAGPVQAAPQAAPQVAQATPEGNGDDADTAQDAGSNVKKAVKNVFKTVAKVGEQYGNGKKALTMLALAVTEAAQNRVIVPSAKGDKDPVAQRLYLKFKETADKQSTLPSGSIVGGGGNEGSLRAQVSKLNSFIKFGNGFADDATAILERAIEVHSGLMANESNKKLLKVTSTYGALIAVAREQMKEANKGVGISNEAMVDLFMGDEKAAKTAADLIEQAINAAKKARDGKQATEKNPEARDPCEHEQLDHAIENLRAVLADIAPEQLAKMDEAENKAKDAEVQAATAEAIAEIDAAE